MVAKRLCHRRWISCTGTPIFRQSTRDLLMRRPLIALETSMRRHFPWSLMVAALASVIAMPAFAADPCAGFKWDVSKEHALFSGPAASLTAGKDSASAPAIDTDRLYE